MATGWLSVGYILDICQVHGYKNLSSLVAASPNNCQYLTFLSSQNSERLLHIEAT